MGGGGGDGVPPPQAQHMALDEKTSLSYNPHHDGEPAYSTQLSPYGSVAPPSVSLHPAASTCRTFLNFHISGGLSCEPHETIVCGEKMSVSPAGYEAPAESAFMQYCSDIAELTAKE
jgi:hypothetical protein